MLTLFIAGVAWAKWLPYAGKTLTLSDTHDWSGTPILGASGAPGATPSLGGALEFTFLALTLPWQFTAVRAAVGAAARSFSWRVTAAVTALVVVGGLAAGALLVGLA